MARRGGGRELHPRHAARGASTSAGEAARQADASETGRPAPPGGLVGWRPKEAPFSVERSVDRDTAAPASKPGARTDEPARPEGVTVGWRLERGVILSVEGLGPGHQSFLRRRRAATSAGPSDFQPSSPNNLSPLGHHSRRLRYRQLKVRSAAELSGPRWNSRRVRLRRVTPSVER
jgi:hypothetical protein